jgi:hypothetical protein
MEGERFDLITKALAARVSRRASVGLVSGVALAVASGRFAARAAAAQAPFAFSGPATESTDPSCKGRAAISGERCPLSQCSRDPDCLCAETVNGQNRCVRIRENTTCPARDECRRNRQCAKGAVCIRVGACCQGVRRMCRPVCG